MEIWFIIILSFCVAAIIKLLLFFSNSHNKKLPPGPSILSSNFILLTNPLAALGPILKELKAKYGTLITLFVGSHPFIFVGEHKLAHQLLIQNGAVFSDRPRTFAICNISSSFYGPTWRLLRRNLSSEALHPSRVKSYAWARKWVLHILVNKLREHEHEEAGGVKVNEHFTYAMFCLLVSMCFGEKFDETRINEIASVQRRVMLVVGPYLKAVILEGLRRHPPGHLVLPHRIMKEVEVQGYVFPQGATINFLVSEMGLDPKVWDNPMESKPERFLANDGDNGVFDISGSKGIKMMPFGAGRRICPGLDLSMLHLEYFVANLIWYLEWGVPNGYNVDLSEKVEFTTVMKNPLQAKISSRAEKLTI